MSQPKKPDPKHCQIYYDIGVNIRYFRNKIGMTQKALAEEAGISPKYLSLIENNAYKHPPSLEIIFELAEILDVLPGDILNGPINCPFYNGIYRKNKLN